jgi:hypothetical protein
MALGRPAINTPRALDLRAVQAAVEGARQRIEALERYVSTLTSTSGTSSTSSSTTNATLAALTADLSTQRSNLAALTARVEILEAAGPAAGPAVGADVVLYDDTGRAILANGQAILVS